jgi:hypothetical protein
MSSLPQGPLGRLLSWEEVLAMDAPRHLIEALSHSLTTYWQFVGQVDPDELAEIYRRTALYKTEIVSLATVVMETKNVFKEITADKVDVRSIDGIREEGFHHMLKSG